MQDSDLKENGYSGCLDDDCLSILSQKLGVENFILWTLKIRAKINSDKPPITVNLLDSLGIQNNKQ